MPAIIAAVVASVTRFFADKITYFLVIKLMVYSLFLIYLPKILKSVVVWMFQGMFCILNSVMGQVEMDSFAIQLSGIGAYLGNCFQVPACMGVILTAISIRMFLNFVPGIK